MLPVCCMEDQIKLAFCAQHRRKSKKKLIILFITILMCFTITKRSNSESSSGKFLHRSTRTLLTEERPTGDIIFSIIRVVSNLWLQIIPSLVNVHQNYHGDLFIIRIFCWYHELFAHHTLITQLRSSIRDDSLLSRV